MTNTNNSQFITRNLGLAAYLVSTQLLQLVDISINSSDPRGVATFVFTDNERAGAKHETEYLSNSARVSPNLFHLQVRSLRKAMDAKRADVSGKRNFSNSIPNARGRNVDTESHKY